MHESGHVHDQNDAGAAPEPDQGAKDGHDTCCLFTDLEAARLIVRLLTGVAKGCLARTSSLARTLVYEDVTALDLRQGEAMDEAEALQAVRRLLASERWRGLESLALPACISTSETSELSPTVALRWPKLRAFTAASSYAVGQVVDRLLLCSVPSGVASVIAPWWQQLSQLRLYVVPVGVAGARALAEGGLVSLTRLQLYRTDLSGEGMRELLAVHWPKLESLSIEKEQLGGTALGHLAAAQHLASLRILCLTDCGLGVEGVRHLAQAGHLSRLESLHLESNQLDGTAMRYLATAPCMSSELIILSLHANPLGLQGLQQLLSITRLVNLQMLTLSETRLSQGSLKLLAAATHLARLEELDLSRNGLAAIDVRHFAAATHFKRLNKLSLSGNRLGPGGIKHLCKAPFLTQLATLHISDVHLGTGIRRLATAHLPCLTHIDIGSIAIDQESLQHLIQHARWPSLHTLDVRWNMSLEELANALLPRARDKWPKLKLLIAKGTTGDRSAFRKQVAQGAWAALGVQ